ncbi:hypothetical protein B0H10DRAFT_575674 [Mycena sp. CBHHK59/15]|nr:hypothetical protein B0H10DRAFT_575674 [Mycena sp. CBHHK59/15]
MLPHPSACRANGHRRCTSFIFDTPSATDSDHCHHAPHAPVAQGSFYFHPIVSRGASRRHLSTRPCYHPSPIRQLPGSIIGIFVVFEHMRAALRARPRSPTLSTTSPARHTRTASIPCMPLRVKKHDLLSVVCRDAERQRGCASSAGTSGRRLFDTDGSMREGGGIARLRCPSAVVEARCDRDQRTGGRGAGRMSDARVGTGTKRRVPQAHKLARGAEGAGSVRSTPVGVLWIIDSVREGGSVVHWGGGDAAHAERRARAFRY